MSGMRGTWVGGNMDTDPMLQQQQQQSNTINNIINNNTAPLMSPQVAYRAAYDSIQDLQQGLQGYDAHVSKVIQRIHQLNSVVESLRQHYEAVVEEKEYISRALEVVEGQMLNVQRMVQRYASVADPVVASDGFTYERELITDYFKECQALKNTPMSKQTHTELTTLLFPNRSFKRFLEQLMETKPVDLRTDGGGSYNNNNNNNNNNMNISGAGNTPAMHSTGRATSNGQISHKHDNSIKGGNNNNNNMMNTTHSNNHNHNTINNNNNNNNAGGHGERLHPCVRVYGYCNYKDTCAYALYPYDACLSHLKGKCRFRAQCHERHVDFRGPLNHTAGNGTTSPNVGV